VKLYVALFRAGASAYLKAAGDVHGTVSINICIGKFTLKPAKYIITTLIMVKSVGHTNDLVSTLRILGIVLWVYTNYQPTLFDIRVPCCRS
jgi:hypothetical protein